MKSFFITCCFLIAITAFVSAQAPQLMNYQAVVRNSAGEILANTQVGIQFTIHDVEASGPVLYRESAVATTNQFGLINTQIGAGNATGTKTLGDINWGSGSKWLEVGMDLSGGDNYTSFGASQLLSVPYALSAASATKGPGSQSAFKAVQSGTAVNCLPKGSTYLPFSKVVFDDRNSYNSATGTFTAPADGVYSFNGLAEFQGTDAKGYMELGFYVNNTDLNGVVEMSPGLSAYWTTHTSTIIKLKAGDAVQLFIYNGTDEPLTNSGNSLVSEFSGYQLY
jgi:hypothetical protein